MKQIETKVALPPQPTAAAKPVLEHEAGSDLAQRLWQMLLALPPVAESSQELGAAGAAGSSATQGHDRDRNQRDNDATGQLASAAQLLAGAVQQLGFFRYEQTDTNTDASQASKQSAPFNLHITNVDHDGGHASLEIAHAQLGEIALEVELSNGSVRVIASAPTEHSAQILADGQALLAERLLRQGIVLEKLDVVVKRGARKQGKRGDSKRTRAPKQETDS
ncbi:MAG: hypothetical protein RL701_3320 [Pseudomonadota bacterium]|jgi:hypothetical protein